MKDNDIIKALECCCDELHCCSVCPYFLQDKENDFCREDMNKDALDLINRQQAEIEEYKRIAEYQQSLNVKRHFELKEKEAEIERLQGLFKGWKRKAIKLSDSIDNIKTEAIKEFAERLKNLVRFSTPLDRVVIDNLAKEMVGDAE